jgi:hypothetical protein
MKEQPILQGRISRETELVYNTVYQHLGRFADG